MPTHQPGDEIDQDIVKQFQRDVNMTASELAHWLETDESRGVGQKDGNSESTGHRSGRRIVELLDKTNSELRHGDVEHMRKVLGYIKRHLAQRPAHPEREIEHSAWRYSLMNWGHDPLKRHR